MVALCAKGQNHAEKYLSGFFAVPAAGVGVLAKLRSWTEVLRSLVEERSRVCYETRP